MEFTTFINQLKQSEVDHHWDSINLVPQEAIDRNWKYSLRRGDKIIPVKWFITGLGRTKDVELDFRSSADNRDKFAEKFGFTIHEELVFDNQDLNRFKKFYENQVKNKELFQFFIDYSSDIVNSLKIDPYKIRMAITQGNEAMIIVGMRAVLSYLNDKIGFIVSSVNVQELKDLCRVERNYDYKGEDDVSYVYTPSNLNVEINITRLLENNKEVIIKENDRVKDSPRSRWNSEANTTNHTFKKVVFEKDNIKSFLFQQQNTMSDTINLEGRRIYKFSMGSLMKENNHKHIDPIKDFEEDGLIVMSKETSHNQGDDFLNKVEIGDYIYLTYGQTRLSFIAKIVTKAHPIKYFKPIDLDDDWYARKVEIIRMPIVNNTFELKDKDGWLPSGYTTLKEIIDLNKANEILFEKYYNVTFINEKGIHNTNEMIETIEVKTPFNQILFGSPGTGKTYKTKKIAVEIIEGRKFSYSQNDREEILILYQKYIESKQIRFTTFHQSLSYEDFIEGIKPKLGGANSQDIEYEVRDGIFKQICHEADLKKTSNNFEESYNKFIEEVIEKGSIVLRSLIHKKPFNVRINSNQNCVAIPQTETGTNMVITKKMLEEYILNDNILDWKTYVTAIGDHIKSQYNITVENSNNQHKNYVLIMDEINRGNVSSIFGELITLIEDDKRKGAKEQIIVDLPYSLTKFSVPKNVYLIGTMNTADRSVEALDTALRRRFSFLEVKADPTVLRTLSSEGIAEGNIDLVKMLTIINQRIELLIDKDHQIGHSYFINVNNLADLKNTFKNKIIPLLEEYFYGDFGKIGLVLGENFITVQDIRENKNILPRFKGYDDLDFLVDKKIFTVKNIMDLTPSDFISIYKTIDISIENE